MIAVAPITCINISTFFTVHYEVCMYQFYRQVTYFTATEIFISKCDIKMLTFVCNMKTCVGRRHRITDDNVT